MSGGDSDVAGEHDDVASELIDALVRGGEPVDAGGFTLDAAAAFAKLRAYQLDDPHAYVLLLVEAGWLAGQGRSDGCIEIRTGATTVVEFRGLALDHAALPELFTAALGRARSGPDRDAQTRARILQLLGLAANVALGLAPESLMLESSTPDGRRTRIRIDPSGAVTVEADTAVGPAATVGPGRLRFELRGCSPHHRRNWAERALVQERCAFTAAQVWLDMKLCSQQGPGPLPDAPPDGSPRTWARIRVGDRVIGIAEHTRDPGTRSLAWIVNRGVAIRTPIDRFGHGVRAIVEVDLPVDLSRKQLLAGPELVAVRTAIRSAVAELAAPPAPVPPTDPKVAQTLAMSFAAVLLIGVGFVLWPSPDETPAIKPKPSVARARADELLAEIHASEAKAAQSRRQKVGPLVFACERDSEDCMLAAYSVYDPVQRDRLLLLGCAVHEADACEDLVWHAREYAAASGDTAAVGLALSLSCRGVAGPDCLEAARYVERGDYPSAKVRAEDLYYRRRLAAWRELSPVSSALTELGPELGADELRTRGCAAGLEDDACAP